MNTFPFNALNGEQGSNEGEFSSFEKRRVERQTVDSRVDFDAVASSRPGNDGKRCIDKVTTTIMFIYLIPELLMSTLMHLMMKP